MTAPFLGVAREQDARSNTGPTVGFADVTTSTTNESVDLSAYAGQYVTIEVEVDDHYVCFSNDSAETIETGAKAVGSVAVPAIVYVGVPRRFVVPHKASYLIYRTKSASAATIRVLPS